MFCNLEHTFTSVLILSSWCAWLLQALCSFYCILVFSRIAIAIANYSMAYKDPSKPSPNLHSGFLFGYHHSPAPTVSPTLPDFCSKLLPLRNGHAFSGSLIKLFISMKHLFFFFFRGKVLLILQNPTQIFPFWGSLAQPSTARINCSFLGPPLVLCLHLYYITAHRLNWSGLCVFSTGLGVLR